MQASYNGIAVPAKGQAIEYSNGKFTVPNHPIIPFIEGDGTGRDIWKASQRVFDAAVETAYRGKRRIIWYEIFAGEKAFNKFGEWLTDDSVKAIAEFVEDAEANFLVDGVVVGEEEAQGEPAGKGGVEKGSWRGFLFALELDAHGAAEGVEELGGANRFVNKN